MAASRMRNHITNTMLKPADHETSAYAEAYQKAKQPNADFAAVLDLLRTAELEGDARAVYALATWHLFGEHLAKDTRRGFVLLKIAASQGVPEAWYDLGVCYEKGAGTRKNVKKAFDCYLNASLRREDQSIYEVWRCYFYGIGIEKDQRLADIWKSRAVELNLI